MNEPIHITITRHVRKESVAEFERLLAVFASESLTVPGSLGVHLLYPPPGAEPIEYGILRSFASVEHLDAFYASPLYQQWTRQIEPMVEGTPVFRKLAGLEGWFCDRQHAMPPRWKMALLTFIAVWPISIAVPAMLSPWRGLLPSFFFAAAMAGGIVVILTWVAMPLLVKLARPWLQPALEQRSAARKDL